MPAQLISKCYNKIREKILYRSIKIYFKINVKFKKEMLLDQSQMSYERKTCTTNCICTLESTAGINFLIYFICHPELRVSLELNSQAEGKSAFSP